LEYAVQDRQKRGDQEVQGAGRADRGTARDGARREIHARGNGGGGKNNPQMSPVHHLLNQQLPGRQLSAMMGRQYAGT